MKRNKQSFEEFIMYIKECVRLKERLSELSAGIKDVVSSFDPESRYEFNTVKASLKYKGAGEIDRNVRIIQERLLRKLDKYTGINFNDYVENNSSGFVENGYVTIHRNLTMNGIALQLIRYKLINNSFSLNSQAELLKSVFVPHEEISGIIPAYDEINVYAAEFKKNNS